MSLLLVTAPTVEPISLDEAKEHLKDDGSAENALIEANIVTVREHAEAVTSRPLISQTWDLFLDAFPAKGVIKVPKPPLQSVTSITYVDVDGVSQILAAAEYDVDAANQPGRIVPAFGKSWPSTRTQINAVTIRIVAGYGDDGDNVPQDIADGMLLLVGDAYEARMNFIIGAPLTPIPKGCRAHDLLWPYRILQV